MSTNQSAIDLSMFDGVVPEEVSTVVTVDAQRIEEAFNALMHFRSELHIVAEKAIAAEEAYDDGEKTCLMGDMVQGKNAELRAAHLADLLSKHAAALRAAKAAERDAELDYRLAVDEVERVKLLVALLGIK